MSDNCLNKIIIILLTHYGQSPRDYCRLYGIYDRLFVVFRVIPSRELFDALVVCRFTLFIDLTTVDNATLLIISQGFDYPYGIDNKEVFIKRYPIADRTFRTIEDARLIVVSCMMKLDNRGKVYIHGRGP